MGWGQRSQEGKAHTRTRVPMHRRPVVICAVSGDRSTYPEFAASLTVIKSTPGSAVFWGIASGGGIAAARNRLALKALEYLDGKPGAIWWVDDDHVFRPDILQSMLQRDVDMCVPRVAYRQPPFSWVAFRNFPIAPDASDEELLELWREHGGPPEITPEDHERGLIELGHCGAAGLLVASEVFEAVPKPYFAFGKLAAAGAGEDSWFTLRARRAGFRLFCDLKAKMSHLTTIAVWPDLDSEGQHHPLFDFDTMRPEPSTLAFFPDYDTIQQWHREVARLQAEAPMADIRGIGAEPRMKAFGNL